MARSFKCRQLRDQLFNETDPLKQIELLANAPAKLKKDFAKRFILTEARRNKHQERIQRVRAEVRTAQAERDYIAANLDYIWKSYVPEHFRYLEVISNMMSTPDGHQYYAELKGNFKASLSCLAGDMLLPTDHHHKQAVSSLLTLLQRFMAAASPNVSFPVTLGEFYTYLSVTDEEALTIPNSLNAMLIEILDTKAKQEAIRIENLADANKTAEAITPETFTAASIAELNAKGVEAD